MYHCPNGLVDAATPVLIEGEHMANLFSGQFFFEPPDLEAHRQRAAQYGFDEAAYIEALSKIPVVPKERVEPVIKFLAYLAKIIGELGLNRLRQIEAKKRAHELKREGEEWLWGILSALHKSIVAVFTRDGTCEFVWGDQGLDDAYGASASETTAAHISQEKLSLIQQVFDTGDVTHDTYSIEMPNGTFTHEITFSLKSGADQADSTVVAFIRDIT